MQLWRRDDNLSIDFDRKTGKGSAQFARTSATRKTKLGRLIIEQNLTLPFWGCMGSLHIRSTTSARLDYLQSREFLDSYFDIQVIEGYFDLLAAFPRRSAQIAIMFSDHDRPYPMRIALDQNEHTPDPHPQQSYFDFDRFSVLGRTFDKYHEGFMEYRLFQATLRYLSRERMRLPEGFLTACNVIESLGKGARSSTEDLIPILDSIEKTLHQNDPYLCSIFKERIRRQFQSTPSFRDRYQHMVNQIKKLGVVVRLKHRPVVEARGRFRHNITNLTQTDIKVMSATIGLSWFYGMNWLFQEIGIPHKALSVAARSTRFHLVRGTGLGAWGRLE